MNNDEPAMLRDRFAMAIIQGMMANPNIGNYARSYFAEAAYAQADVMVAEREKAK